MNKIKLRDGDYKDISKYLRRDPCIKKFKESNKCICPECGRKYRQQGYTSLMGKTTGLGFVCVGTKKNPHEYMGIIVPLEDCGGFFGRGLLLC